MKIPPGSPMMKLILTFTEMGVKFKVNDWPDGNTQRINYDNEPLQYETFYYEVWTDKGQGDCEMGFRFDKQGKMLRYGGYEI